MNKKWLVALLTAALGGCSSVPQGSIPVVDAGTPLSAGRIAGASAPTPAQAQTQQIEEDSGVVVMVPQGAVSTPLQTGPQAAPSSGGLTFDEPPISAPQGNVYSPAPSAPSGIPSGGGLAADEQLDGPVLALLTTAQQQQGSGDLNGASSSLERAQRIAPREPQVLYRLAEVRLAQGDAAQAEQFARRGLTYASGRPALQASLWNLIAQARERQGDPAGAAKAREQARVTL
ncbi:tetratricopeptide repeat protein [Pseudomonas sp. AA-38]|uniref:tetratricopeptide repeat protein n=1 Tax=Pseudomonas sp. AA-38 TaxID=3028807 RepID=UPI0023F7A2D1|nr:tetratricopeptide repeat protein [Pseudomonas sp. AA-38]